MKDGRITPVSEAWITTNITAGQSVRNIIIGDYFKDSKLTAVE